MKYKVGDEFIMLDSVGSNISPTEGFDGKIFVIHSFGTHSNRGTVYFEARGKNWGAYLDCIRPLTKLDKVLR